MRELCERCLVNPKLDENPPEVSWANTNLLLSERLTCLNATKPWQLNLAKGEEELLMTVPAGVEIRSKPLRSRRASGAGDAGAATAPTFSKSPGARRVESQDAKNDDDGVSGDEKPGKVRKRAPDPDANVTAKPASSDSPSSDVSEKKRETSTDDPDPADAIREPPPAMEAAEARAAEDLAEHAAAGLMAVAAGLPAPKKRGRGRPRKNPEQKPPMAARARDPTARRGGKSGFPGGSGGGAGDAGALSPALLSRLDTHTEVVRAAYEAGRAAAAAAAADVRTATVATAARANPPSVADIVDKFYTHRRSTTAEEAFPLDSFRAAGELAGAGSGTGPTAAPGAPSFDAGSAANEKALWQWNQTLAMLSGQAGHPPGAFVDLSSPYASLFAPPGTAAELHRVREANERALSDVSSVVEEVRLAAAAVAAEGHGARDPSARAAFVAKVERVLRVADEKKSRIPTSQRVETAKNVLALRAWVKTQLHARIKELATRAWEPKPRETAGARSSKAAAKDEGRTPAPAEETPAFSLLATVAAASDGERGAFPAISSDSDPTEA